VIGGHLLCANEGRKGRKKEQSALHNWIEDYDKTDTSAIGEKREKETRSAKSYISPMTTGLREGEREGEGKTAPDWGINDPLDLSQ